MAVTIKESSVIVGKVRLGEKAYIAQGAVLRSEQDSLTLQNQSFVLENSVLISSKEYPIKVGSKTVFGHKCIVVGAEIGDYTMVDMNAVVGARGKLGKRVHLGAGAVIAGVLEPPSKRPCVIEDNVMIGANAVILEGVHVGEGAVIAAGSIVTEDVPPKVVVAGAPAKIIKAVDKKTQDKTKLLDDLR